MEFKDLIITPFYLLLIYVVAFQLRKKLKPRLQIYFIPALTVKIAGAILVGLIYQFYYGGGDTFNFVNLGSKHIYEAFLDSPYKAFLIFIDNGKDKYPEIIKYTSKIYYYHDTSSFFIVKLAAFCSFFCFQTYAVMAVFFSLFSFLGSWLLYSAFCRIYPSLYKTAAWAIFFIPSIFFWGSGLLKDSITFGAVGLLFYAFTNIVLFRRKLLLSFALLLVSAYILFTVKIYILICLIPSLILWSFLHFNYLIQSKLIRSFLKPLVIVFALLIAYFATNYISSSSKRYSFETVTTTMKETAWWLSYVSKVEGGAYYSLGDLDYSPWGMLKKAPAAIGVTLFRPYLWESKNVVMLLSALESFFFLLFTIVVFYRTGIRKAAKIIRQDPFVFFAFAFTLSFAFAIGISTYNFGALVRYKIPILPFYLLALLVINSYSLKKRSGRRKILAFQEIDTPESEKV